METQNGNASGMGTGQPTPSQTPTGLVGQPRQKNLSMAVLSYIGPLVVVSFLIAKNDPFVKFHIKQGFVLLVLEAAIWVLGMMFFMLWPFLQIVNLAAIVLSVIGIVNVVQNKEKELPFIGHFSKHFNI